MLVYQCVIALVHMLVYQGIMALVHMLVYQCVIALAHMLVYQHAIALAHISNKQVHIPVRTKRCSLRLPLWATYLQAVLTIYTLAMIAV